ncbi:bifunctional metallophosphatase/5'-nucleotidase [Flavobacterium sp. GSP27]|uniref:bifunctional metallophosphatase/5'-nucleotidase n=1 Tax=Flavobacterium sp. GSP27 TaxID=2497489 RepID=UPI000F8469DC|nr:5'-nucleotidase C-terminal domain-containing protein [Flavobacterium sp. GSP27]RTY94511.1 bifunctional metallophosphatase/5'-nucleotidase [Flavobacterium sp. GSN2]RTZ10548.1 bifunctional metallophosphatase/5'-nucleotidase [Flavobacterium sp. GSP27]
MSNNRRNFLKSVGTLSLGAVIISPISVIANTTEPTEKNLNIAIDGTKPQTITILQTTDVHCQIHPHDELFWENGKAVFRKTGGYAYMATLLKQLKKKNPNTYTIDTGDMFQGSELSVETTGEAFVPILNALNYDLYLPGNWEVIYGKRKMQTLLGSLDAPKICTNMYHDLGNGKRGELIFQPYTIWHVAGAKIGFLGYTDPLVPLRQSPNYSKGIIYTDPEENLAHYVDVLRNQEQCSYVLIIAHLGLSQQIALANRPECEGVNYILGGDTHERVRKPIVCKYSKVVEPGAFGSFIGKLDLTILNGKVIDDNYELLEVDSPKIKPDATIEKLLIEKEFVYQEQINTIIGYSTIPLYRYFVVENPIDTMILNALHWKFPDIDINLSNGFRFCPPKTTPDQTGNIPITNGFIFDMLPVDSTVRTAKVTGKQLKNWLEKELNNVFAYDASKRFGGWVVKFKGMEVRFNAFAEMDKRVQSITMKNTPLDPDKLYSIMACERDGDPVDMLCRMKGVMDAKNTNETLHSVMRDYLKQNSPVTPTPQKNAIILDAPETLLTQVTGVDYTFR